MALTKQDIIQELKDLKEHSCSADGDEYGIYHCCYQPDFKGHAPDCKTAMAINLAIKLIEYPNG